MKKTTTQELMKKVTSFAALCAVAGVNEADYVMPETVTPEQGVAICLKRLWLFSKVFNGGEKMDMANTNQLKIYPAHRVIPDKGAPRGFRLSYNGYIFDYDFARLGARPYFNDSNVAKFVGTEHVNEYVELAHYTCLACNQ